MDQPSEAQIKAGNYPKGHVYAHGMRISIENEADSVRSGTDKNGEPWDSRMQHDYGYIRGTKGADGDHLDVFLGPDFKSREVPVFVIDQHDPDTKDFDEHKVMLGFKTKDEALRAYMGNYPDGHTGARAITPMHIDKFKQWMAGPGAKKSVSKTRKMAAGGAVRRFAYGGWSDDFSDGSAMSAAPAVSQEAVPQQPADQPQQPADQPQQPADQPQQPADQPQQPVAAPSNEAMASAWDEHKKDPAKIWELMQANGVGVNQAAKFLGVNNNSMAGYLNSGRSAGVQTTGHGDEMEVKEHFKYNEVTPEAQTREEFDASVEPWMLDEQGKFKRPHDGVNYRWEGMTPGEVFADRQRQLSPAEQNMAVDGQDGNKLTYLPGQGLRDPINLKWEAGPDTGGGVLGGLARAVGNLGTGITKNPALMAALTAGVGQYFSPAPGAGAAAGGTGTGGSAGIGSGTTFGGGAASSTWAPVQSFMTGPYAQPALNAVKTVASGGSPMDALKSAGTTYFGGQLSNAAVANNPFPSVLSPSAVRYLTNYAVKKAVPKKLADGGSTSRVEDQQRYAKNMEHSNAVIKQMLRGWVAGTAGLPGDIEGLARKVVGWGASEGSPVDAWSKRPPVMPTTEFYKEWLPGATEDPRLQAAADAGSLFGGAGTGAVTKPIVAAGRGAGALTMAAGQAAERGLEPVVNKIMAADGKGAQLLMDLAQGSRSNVIKAPGGNWLSGSVEDSLKGLKRKRTDEDIAEIMGSVNPDDAWSKTQLVKDLALNTWVDKQLTRYVKNDMATERDPIRALAEQGTLHYTPGRIESMALGPNRLEAGFSPGGLGNAPTAQAWERMADVSVLTQKAGKYQQEVGPGWEKNLWLDKTAPEVPVHSTVGGIRTSRGLGFDHLADELRNAMNPDSGLPRHLQLKPESLNQVSVPQAVKLVSDINKWRADQKVAANQAIANNTATFVHKEYPDTGFKWVELKTSTRPNGPAGAEYLESKRALQDALKYEGDTMGHCVGGYCDDVASGNTRILSLRDAKGEPHATVELGPAEIKDKADYAERLRRVNWTPERIDAELARLGAEGRFSPAILQIKGKGNKGVADKYRAMVQDFLNTFEHSAAQDLQLNGLRATKDAWNVNELAKIKAMGIDVPKYATQQKIDDIGNIVWPGQWGKAK